MVSVRDKHCIPHIWKKLVLLSPEMGTTKIDNNAALVAWCALAQKVHHEQLNLCKYYEQAGELYLVAGLTAHTTLSAGQAEVVAFSVWETMRQGQLPLPQAYQAHGGNVNLLSATEGHSPAKRECGTSARHTQTEPAHDAEPRNDTDDTEMPDPLAGGVCRSSYARQAAGPKYFNLAQTRLATISNSRSALTCMTGVTQNGVILICNGTTSTHTLTAV